jgi:DNA-binding IscR family transcriptional regulator
VLTKKGKYGLKATVHLAGLEPDGLAQVADIAKTNSGLVYSKKGKGGGYALARPAHEIRVGAIVRALDGPLAPFPARRSPRSDLATIAEILSPVRSA